MHDTAACTARCAGAACCEKSRCAEVIKELTKLRDSGEHPALRDGLQGEIDYLTAIRQRMG